MLCAAAFPGLGEGPAFGRCCTMFVRMMAGIFHFSGVNKQEYFLVLFTIDVLMNIAWD